MSLRIVLNHLHSAVSGDRCYLECVTARIGKLYSRVLAKPVDRIPTDAHLAQLTRY